MRTDMVGPSAAPDYVIIQGLSIKDLSLFAFILDSSRYSI